MQFSGYVEKGKLDRPTNTQRADYAHALVRTLYKIDISLRRTHSVGRKGHKGESTVALY